MAKIRLLEKSLYELIAAGEVIERPASIVKELVENAIDAKATVINVDIKHGGKSVIRVVDNGIGMDEQDCKLAFLRHATSKVSTKDDLDNINTLGFRGEALASICAVSKVELLTKRKEDGLGTRYVIEGGEEKEIEPIGCSNGTTISINQIFYNVPARLKFLKKDSTEGNAIQDILEKLAISNHNISFNLKKDGKQIFQTPVNGSFADTVYAVFGREFYKSLIPVKYNYNNIYVEGFVSVPMQCRSNRSMQNCFINDRYVKSKTCVVAVEEAFKGFSMIGKFPAFILHINMDPQNLDVNVHPAKIEVRFSDEREVLKAVYNATKDAISKYNALPKSDNKQNLNRNYFSDNENSLQTKIIPEKLNSEFDVKSIQEKSEVSSKFPLNSSGFSSEKSPYKMNETDKFLGYKFLSNSKIGNKKDAPNKPYSYENKNEDLHKEKDIDENENSYNEKTDEILDDKTAKFVDDHGELRIIGEVFRTYILAEIDDNFIVVDKHAAHERILYEKLKKEAKNLERQILLLPIPVTMSSNEEHELVLDNSETLVEFGFCIEDFGAHSVLIREIPAVLDDKDCKDVFEEIVENLVNKKQDITPHTLDNMYHTIACRAAIKANDDNDIIELKALMDRVYYDENIRTCPHGRPVILTFKKERFDKKFGRIQ